MLHILSPAAVMMPTMAFVSSVRGHGTNSAAHRCPMWIAPRDAVQTRGRLLQTDGRANGRRCVTYSDVVLGCVDKSVSTVTR